MNDFKQLKAIQVDSAKKQHDFEQVTARLQKSVMPWQVPVALVGVMTIAFFLIFTSSGLRQTTAINERELTAVYSVYGEGDPFSIWQMWVTRSTDRAVLHEYEAVLGEAKHIESFDDAAELSETYRFVYSDGTSAKYASYYSDDHTYLYDVENQLYYEITDTVRYYKIKLMDGYSDKKQYVYMFIIAAVLYLIVNYFVSRKMRDEENPKKSLPTHSTHWQTVVIVCAFSLITLLAIIIPNLHYVVAVCILMFATLCNILLEKRWGQHPWRMLNFAVSGFWYVVVLMNLFLM